MRTRHGAGRPPAKEMGLRRTHLADSLLITDLRLPELRENDLLTVKLRGQKKH